MEFNEIDFNTISDYIKKPKDSSKTKENHLLLIEPKKETDKSVLGIDILKYSQYNEEVQLFIPIVFHTLYQHTWKQLLIFEPYLFNFYKNLDNSSNFYLDQGDGCFIIFPTPLHSFVFAAYFELSVQTYNAGLSLPNLINAFGNDAHLSVRYAITFGKLSKIKFSEKFFNYYGNAVISNARILSKDKLNRFLIDENSHQWFFKYFQGFENLPYITMHHVHQSLQYSSITFETPTYFDNESKYLSSRIFPFFDEPSTIAPNEPPNNLSLSSKDGFVFVIVQRLASMQIKEKNFSVYSIYTQFRFTLTDAYKNLPFSIALGNTNPAGLVE